MPTPQIPSVRVAGVVDAVRTRLWPLPTAAVGLAVLLGELLVVLDGTVGEDSGLWLAQYGFAGGPDAARAVLAAVSGSLITVASLTFSLTVVTLQLASSQYSPRLLRIFARDAAVQGTLAVFLATFTFSLTVLRSVRGSDGEVDVFVPRLSVTVAFLLAVASVVVLVLFLGHMAREIRVEMVVARVHEEARAVAARVYPAGEELPPPPAAPTGRAWDVCAPSSGFVTQVDAAAVRRTAADHGVVVYVDVAPGAFVVAGTPVARVWPAQPPAAARISAMPPADPQAAAGAVARALRLGPEPTAVQDVGFSLRQITDVVVKALSPGVNDPTTAVHSLGWSSAVLVDLAGRPCGPDVVRDDDGTLRGVLARPDFATLLHLAVDQPLLYGASDPVVLHGLTVLLEETGTTVTRPVDLAAVTALLTDVRTAVEDVCPPAHRPALRRRLVAVRARLNRVTASAEPPDAVPGDQSER